MPAPRRARHHDTTFRPVLTGEGSDAWRRQADAAAWSAVSGMAPSLYLGGIEPIPVPAELRNQMREAAAQLTAMPSRDRAEVLLRLAHQAAYGPDALPPEFHGAAGPAVEPPREPAGGASGTDWWDTPTEAPKSLSDALNRFADEAHAALAASDWQTEDGGEVPRPEHANPSKEWWE